MKLTEKQEIKLAWLVNQNKAKGFRATNPEVYGFDDIEYVVRIEGVELGFEFRLFHKQSEFQYTQFTPMSLCPYILQACDQLQKALEELLVVPREDTE